MSARQRRYTPEERSGLVERYRSWDGAQRDFARAMGVPAGTMGRWLSADRVSREAASIARRREGRVPTLVEVVPISTATVVTKVRSHEAGTRLVLGGDVALVFDALPPASWVAELAVELRRC